MNMTYWLLKGVARGNDNHPVIGDVLGVVSFMKPGSFPICEKIDKVLGLKLGEWCWRDITKAEYETYLVFGFKEYSQILQLDKR